MSPSRTIFSASILSVCLLILFATLQSASASTRGKHCTNATSIDLNTTLRVDGYGTTQQCYEVHVESSSYLSIDVIVPNTARVEAQLTFFGPSCGNSQRSRPSFSYVERQAASILLEIEKPGDQFFCVASQDPRLTLNEYKLRTALVEMGEPLGTDPRCTCQVPDPLIDVRAKGGDPSEVLPDPNPFFGGCTKGGDPSEVVPDPNPLFGGCTKGGDPSEIVPDPNPLFAGCTKGGDPSEKMPDPLVRPRHNTLANLCSSGEIDDHGNTLACATGMQLGEVIVGEIENDWADDDDFFMFVVSAHTTVEIQTRGRTDTAGALYDRFGHRLTIDEDHGEGTNFRIVKTLAPGRYFVQVYGSLQVEGTYRFSVDPINWQ